MSAGSWLTGDEVAAYLDVPYPDDDGRVDLATDAVRAAVESRRSDLVFDGSEAVPADVHTGSIMWASILYQARAAPSGFPGYDAESQIYDQLGARRAEVMRLIGWRRPVVA